MKPVEVLVLAEAVQDLEAGAAYYDERQPGVGEDFWDSLLADIERLEFTAGVHVNLDGYRRMAATRFPYAIYYRIRRDAAQVLAVLPMRRHPMWLERQLRRRRPQSQ